MELLKQHIKQNIFSIHTLYSELCNSLTVKQLLMSHNIKINNLYSCCGKHHTLLSYSVSISKYINLSVVIDLLINGGKMCIILPDNTSALYYLFLNQDIDTIKTILQCTNPLNIMNIHNINKIIDSLIYMSKKNHFIFLTSKCYKLLFSNNIINKLKKYNKIEWLFEACKDVYYTLILISHSKTKNYLCCLSDEIIMKIYKMIFLSDTQSPQSSPIELILQI